MTNNDLSWLSGFFQSFLFGDGSAVFEKSRLRWYSRRGMRQGPISGGFLPSLGVGRFGCPFVFGQLSLFKALLKDRNKVYHGRRLASRFWFSWEFAAVL